MIRCLDIHTHHDCPQPYGVVDVSCENFTPNDGQFFSVGLHPWSTAHEPSPELWANMEKAATNSCVVAIGECGIDKLKGGPLFRQMLVFKRQIDLSEKLQKPLIIHDVKAHDVIVGIKKDLNPSQNWVVHGFRGKPTVAKMLTDAGIFLSFGENFNEDSLKSTPHEMILAETDESLLDIFAVIEKISKTLERNFTEQIAVNVSKFLGLNDNLTS